MEKFELLRRSPLFDMLSPQEVEFAAELARPRRYLAGETVFEEGDRGDSVFVVASGAVEVVRRAADGAPLAIAVFEAPQFFGEMSLIDKRQRSATARAKSETTLLQLTAENLAAFRRHNRDGFTMLVLNIARTLSARLREANNRSATPAA